MRNGMLEEKTESLKESYWRVENTFFSEQCQAALFGFRQKVTFSQDWDFSVSTIKRKKRFIMMSECHYKL